jgi:imidazolonepropionase-like amidohydrolase
MIKTLYTFILTLSATIFAKAQQFDTYINNINVISISKEGITPNQSIGIKNNKIVYIGKAIKASFKNKIDGTGKYIMPSLYDMHVHWPDVEPKRFLQLCLATGITKVRIMKSTTATISFVKNEKINNSALPSLSISFPITEETILNQNHIPILIDSIKKAGYDFIKIFSLKEASYFKIIVKEARKHNLALCGHALGNVPASEVLSSGYKSVEHVGYLDKAKKESLDSMLQIFAANKTYICPTMDWDMMVYHSIPEDSLQDRMGYQEGYQLYKTHWDTTYANHKKEIPEADRPKYAAFMSDRVKKKIAILTKAHQNKITLIAGSDAEEPFQTPGYSLLEELGWIQKAGLSNDELLKTVTLNAATYFNEQKSYGTIEKNKVAHLIILTKNPLENIKNLSSVESILYKSSIINKVDLLKSIK